MHYRFRGMILDNSSGGWGRSPFGTARALLVLVRYVMQKHP
jgi:hypothetical protein